METKNTIPLYFYEGQTHLLIIYWVSPLPQIEETINAH